jgi:hypothetical protein
MCVIKRNIQDTNMDTISESFYIFHQARQQVRTSATALFNILDSKHPTLQTKQHYFFTKRVIESLTFYGAADQNAGRQPV